MDAVTVVELPNSVEMTPAKSLALNISPNPAEDEILVSYEFDQPTEYHLRLTDVNGTLVHSEFHIADMPGPQSKVMSIRNLPEGVYFIQLITTQGIGIKKVVVRGPN
jgi:hypothetical protein